MKVITMKEASFRQAEKRSVMLTFLIVLGSWGYYSTINRDVEQPASTPIVHAQEAKQEVKSEPATEEDIEIEVPIGSDLTGEGIVVTTPPTESALLFRVRKFIKSYGGKIDEEYLQQLHRQCGDKYLPIVVAISVSETGMGKATKNRTNFYGWYKGGNKRYDPSKSTMAQEICHGIKTHYPNIDKGVGLQTYTGHDRSSTWFSNFSWALSQMR